VKISSIFVAFLENMNFKNDSLGAHFFEKKFLLITSILKTLYFLKTCPIFDEQSAVEFTKYSGFL
jgi:hypothetical protein